MGAKQSDLEMSIMVQGHNVTGIMKMQWYSFHGWNTAMEEYRLLGRTECRDKEGDIVPSVSGQLECMELCLGLNGS